MYVGRVHQQRGLRLSCRFDLLRRGVVFNVSPRAFVEVMVVVVVVVVYGVGRAVVGRCGSCHTTHTQPGTRATRQRLRINFKTFGMSLSMMVVLCCTDTNYRV